jgi:DNA-binding MarR family transcriptional regulator
VTDERAPVSLGFLLWHGTLRWQRLIAAALRPLELTHVQFVLLAVLWWFGEVAGERPTQRALAGQAGTDPMMTSQVVRALERRGLVRRRRHPDDARAVELEVTPAGAKLAVQAIEVVERVDDEFFAGIRDRAALESVLTSLAGLQSGQPVPARVSSDDQPEPSGPGSPSS